MISVSVKWCCITVDLILGISSFRTVCKLCIVQSLCFILFCTVVVFCCFIILQEIIEFPVLKVNGITFEIESQFHQYVQPDVNKELTDFCTEVNSSDIWTSTMHDTIQWWYDCVLKTSSRGVSLYSLYTQHSCCLIGSVGAWRNRLSCYVFIC